MTKDVIQEEKKKRHRYKGHQQNGEQDTNIIRAR
jgi:hypothetical protein